MTRPRPAAQLAQGFVVERDEHDVAARLVPVEAVPEGPERSLDDFPRADQSEDEASKSHPQQQLAAWSLRPDFRALRHQRSFLPRGLSRMRVKRLGFR